VAAQEHATIWPSASMAPSSAHAEAEDRKLRKDPIGGPCFEGTLQKPTGVSESSPVAGTIENSTFSESLDAGPTREIHTNMPDCHTLLSVNCLYQMNAKNCKGEFKKYMGWLFWSPGGPDRAAASSLEGGETLNGAAAKRLIFIPHIGSDLSLCWISAISSFASLMN